MLSESLRTRLRKLNQSRRLLRRAVGAQAPPVPPRRGPVGAPARPTASAFGRPRIRLEQGHAESTPRGEFWLVRCRLEELWPAWKTGGIPGQALGEPPHGPADLGADYEAFVRSFPQDSLFLDLETCGFAGSSIFLAGTIHWQDAELWLSQFWARSYAEEAALLHALAVLLHTHALLVTFNGKSFDWPQIRDRTILFRGSADSGLPELPHLDLLHVCRRRWKHALPDCKLQTLERWICGRLRSGDLPGHEIPDAYHAYVRTGDTSQVDAILHHNALDLITLLQLALTVGGHLGAPGKM